MIAANLFGELYALKIYISPCTSMVHTVRLITRALVWRWRFFDFMQGYIPSNWKLKSKNRGR